MGPLPAGASSESCTRHCPTDCSGSWSEWTKCGDECEQANLNIDGIADPGEQTRTFQIKRPAQYGGKPCQSKRSDSRRCKDARKHKIGYLGLSFQTGTKLPAYNTLKGSNYEDAIKAAVFGDGPHPKFNNIIFPCETQAETRQYFPTSGRVRGVAGTCENPARTTKANDGKDGYVVYYVVLYCPLDCKGSWSPWSSCADSKCGNAPMQSTRKLTILRQNSMGGKPCSGESSKTCPCTSDCKGEWWVVFHATEHNRVHHNPSSIDGGRDELGYAIIHFSEQCSCHNHHIISFN